MALALLIGSTGSSNTWTFWILIKMRGFFMSKIFLFPCKYCFENTRPDAKWTNIIQNTKRTWQQYLCGKGFPFHTKERSICTYWLWESESCYVPIDKKNVSSHFLLYTHVFSGLRTLTWIHLVVKNFSPVVIGILTLIHGRGGGWFNFCKVSLTLDFRYVPWHFR